MGREDDWYCVSTFRRRWVISQLNSTSSRYWPTGAKGPAQAVGLGLSAKTTHGPHQSYMFSNFKPQPCLPHNPPSSNTNKYASQTKEENPSSAAISPSFTVIYRRPGRGENASESWPKPKMLALQPESAQEKPASGNLSYLPTGNVKALPSKLLYPCS